MKSETTIQTKYKAYRALAKDGDLILWRKNNSIMASLIRFFDNHYIDDSGKKVKDPAKWNHISVVYWGRAKRLLNSDAWSNGVASVPCSHRVRYYDDFMVLRLNTTKPQFINQAIDKVLLNDWVADVPYDHFTLLRIAIWKRTGIDFTFLGDPYRRAICSRLAQKFCMACRIGCYNFIDKITPQDFVRFADKDEVEVLEIE